MNNNTLTTRYLWTRIH